MQRTLALEIYFDPNPTFMMEQVNVTETQNMEVTMKKGFLESSGEFISMQPFKAHARGLVAYTER